MHMLMHQVPEMGPEQRRIHVHAHQGPKMDQERGRRLLTTNRDRNTKITCT